MTRHTRNQKKPEYKEDCDEESDKDFSADEDENYVEEDASSDDSRDEKVSKKKSTKPVVDNQLPVDDQNASNDCTTTPCLPKLHQQPASKREVYLGIIKNELYISNPPETHKKTSAQWEKGMKFVYFTDDKQVCHDWYCCSICAWLVNRPPGASTGNTLAHVYKHDKDDYNFSRVDLASLISKATMVGKAMSPTKVKKMLPAANDWDANFLDALIPNAVKTAENELAPDVSSMVTWSEDQLKKSALLAIRRNTQSVPLATQQTQSAISQEQKTSGKEPPNTTITSQQTQLEQRSPKSEAKSREPEQHDKTSSSENLEKVKRQLEKKSLLLLKKSMPKLRRLEIEAEIVSLKAKLAASAASSCSVAAETCLMVASTSHGNKSVSQITKNDLIAQIIHDHSKLIDEAIESDDKLLSCDKSAMKIVHKENFCRQHEPFIDSLIKDLDGDFTDGKLKSLRVKFNLYMTCK